MLPAVFLFRDALDMAWRVGRIMRLTRGVKGRHYWVGLGGLLGLLAAALAVAALLGLVLSGSFIGLAGLLIALIGLRILQCRLAFDWPHAIDTLCADVAADRAPHKALAVAVGRLVLADGVEAGLFLVAVALAFRDDGAWWAPGIGALAGCVLGGLGYLGFDRLPIARVIWILDGVLAVILAGLITSYGMTIAPAPAITWGTALLTLGTVLGFGGWYQGLPSNGDAA